MKIKLWDIYKVFTKIGLILIGGGYVILPLLRDEIITNKQWITEDDLVNYFALSQTLPGLIAGNISIFIGYKLRGKLGATIAMLGITTGPFLCIAAITPIIHILATAKIMKGVFWGIDIGVIIMLVAAIQEMWHKSIVDKFTIFLFGTLLFSILKYKLTPIPVIISAIIIGILYKKFVTKNEREPIE